MYPEAEKYSVLDLREGSGRAGGKLRLLLAGAAFFSVSVLLSLAIARYGVAPFLLCLAVLLALPLAYLVLVSPRAGILILLTAAYFIMFFGKFLYDFPLGTLMDATIGLLLIGFFLKQKYERNWAIFNTGITAVIVLWIVYNILEALNPAAESRLAWLYAVRPIALVTLTYFIFQYHIRDKAFIRSIFKLWIVLSAIGALYGLKQEFFGFSDFEISYIKSDPIITSLYFIGNHWRRFSIYSDPVSFAYNMVISSILCFCLMTGPLKRWKKLTLGGLACLFLFSMLYSGTRGAYVLLPAAYFFFIVLRYNARIMIVSLLLAAAAMYMVFMPTSNYTLYRFQTAFKPDHDASFNLRKANQKRIQPFIQSHPLGGGIGATGVWGKRFSPYSYLANFPPDSGYVRVAVENGWVGLVLFCTLMFIILRTGITNYFNIRDPELRSYCLAMLIIVFALNIGNYPQEALVQYPVNIYFYLAVALINVTLKLDREQRSDRPITAPK